MHNTLTNQLAADVTMTNANQWYDGPSVTLTSGKKYLVAATLHINPTNSSEQVGMRLFDGTTSFISAGEQGSAVGSPVCLSVQWVITGSGVAVKAQAISNVAGATLKAATISNSVGNNAASIAAVQLD